MVTASHNPPADNGYKVYLGTGAQIVPPADAEIAARASTPSIRAPSSSPTPDDPLIERARPDAASTRYLDARAGRAPAARRCRACPSPTRAMHGVGGDALLAAFDRAGLAAAVRRRRPAGARTATFPTVVVPQPGGAGGDGPAARRWPPSAARRSPSPTTPTPTGWARRSRSPTVAGAGCTATRSAGCSPTTSCATPPATTASSSPRWCRRRCSARMAAAHGVHYAETYTGFKWIGHTILEHPELALRARLRAGARLPRVRPPAGQGRDHRRGAARRGRRARRGRGRHAAGATRRHRRRATAGT